MSGRGYDPDKAERPSNMCDWCAHRRATAAVRVKLPDVVRPIPVNVCDPCERHLKSTGVLR